MRNEQFLIGSVGSVLVLMSLLTSNSFAAEKKALQLSERGPTTWSELPWPVLLERLCAVAKAPKLYYRVERMEVYRDGVWVDYSVTNLSFDRKYITPTTVSIPIGRMSMWDRRGEPWKMPKDDPDITFQLRDPDTFIRLEPFASVRFRTQVSFSLRKPIEPVAPARVRRDPRPKELTLRVMGWSRVYTQLTEKREVRVPSFDLGFGKVPVKWVDKPSPPSWKFHTRLPD